MITSYDVGCSSFLSENGSNSVVAFSASILADGLDLFRTIHENKYLTE